MVLGRRRMLLGERRELQQPYCPRHMLPAVASQNLPSHASASTAALIQGWSSESLISQLNISRMLQLSCHVKSAGGRMALCLRKLALA